MEEMCSEGEFQEFRNSENKKTRKQSIRGPKSSSSWARGKESIGYRMKINKRQSAWLKYFSCLSYS